jgi:hypothetical protein
MTAAAAAALVAQELEVRLPEAAGADAKGGNQTSGRRMSLGSRRGWQWKEELQNH